MTYPEAIEALRGHPNWWYYDYHGRDDATVQAEAIELAQTWVRPDLLDAHFNEASGEIPSRPCGSC
jgi:hypothetical protein